MKIFHKTFCYTLALLVLIAVLANGLVYALMPAVYTNQMQQNLAAQADRLQQHLNVAESEDIIRLMGRSAAVGQTNVVVKIGEEKYAMTVWSNGSQSDGVFTTTATVVTDMITEETVSSSITLEDDGDGVLSVHFVDPGDSPSYDSDRFSSPGKTISAQRYFTIDGESGSLTVSMALSPVEEAVKVIVSLLPVSILLCVVIAIVFSFLFARVITRPIKAISNETRHMTLLERNARCKVQSKDEFGALAANVNGLYENLLSTIDSLETELKKVAGAEKAKTDFLRAASHELKTPATAVSVIMDNMILGVGKYKDHEQWLPKCKELVDNLTDKLRDILDASRLDGISEPFVTKSVETLCSDVLEPYLIIARARGLSIYIDWSAAFPVTVPPELLGKALSNIFSNAVIYTAPEGSFSVYCKGRSLIVENECAPIPKEHLSRLSEPFYRPDISRSRETGGNGLGLYIVETILRRLELEYRFEPMTSPEGMRFTISF